MGVMWRRYRAGCVCGSCHILQHPPHIPHIPFIPSPYLSTAPHTFPIPSPHNPAHILPYPPHILPHTTHILPYPTTSHSYFSISFISLYMLCIQIQWCSELLALSRSHLPVDVWGQNLGEWGPTCQSMCGNKTLASGVGWQSSRRPASGPGEWALASGTQSMGEWDRRFVR